ncbi:MAG: preprotein translocase subunit SecG [Verrucomicrobia bacterium]|nr:MAG: preprotein translocase subunit SecG [Verrucomicrobiota bacterium]
MTFLIGFLTVILVLDCLLLILLVLIQLPKKDAGAGIAFGGGATDALFGAGSGTALTKITKYAAGVFLGLSLLLSYMRAHDSGENLEEKLRKKAASAPLVTPSATNTVASTTAVPVLLLSPTNAVATNPPDGSAK